MTVSIIGAGVSGLSLGCYLQMNGFETVIYEKGTNAGGLCTSWKRGEYTFNGAVQWLMGSNESNPFFQLWSELLDMKSIRFVGHDTRVDIELKNSSDKKGDRFFHLYTNLDRLQNYLLENAPEDEKWIRKLMKAMRQIQRYEVPPMVRSVTSQLSFQDKLGYVKHLPLLLFMLKWKSVTNKSFARRLRNPFFKEAMENLFDGDDLPLLILMVPLAFDDRKGVGYPVGGSAAFSGKLEERYLSLGGAIRYNTPVKEISVEKDRATGVVLENGETVGTDFAVSAADWYFTVFKALHGKYVNSGLQDLGDLKVLDLYYSVIMISIGVDGEFPAMPHVNRFLPDTPLCSPDGTPYDRIETHCYNYDPTLAPAGKTVFSFTFYTRNADFWIQLRRENPVEYLRVKTDFANQVVEQFETRYGPLKEKIEVMDVATPATFERYTSNRKGSVQGWFPGKNLIARLPATETLPGLQSFYLCGHWTQPGGGLPIAIKSARDVAQLICRKSGKKFKVKI
jgi:phytoene dehydrogenase-like protein